MRIGFDARLMTETGVGRYIKNLLGQYLRLNKDDEFFIFLSPYAFNRFAAPAKNWHKVKISVSWHSFSEQLILPLILLRYRLDLVHFPYFNVPILYPGKYIITVHDLIIDHFPTGRASTLPFLFYHLKRISYRLIMHYALRHASKILAISKSTRREIIDHYGINPEKITVTYDALEEGFIKSKQNYTPRKKYDFDYFLYVGNAYPHKNLALLCRAFTDSSINSKLKLVLAGDDHFFYPRLKKFVGEKKLDDYIIFAGHCNDRSLSELYKSARGLIIPSLMEGFGLPNLEAVYFNCLPIVSDIPVFREIWGNDLIYFNPRDIKKLKTAMLRLINLTASEKNKILLKAKLVLKKFSWQATAADTLLQYRLV